MTLTCRVLSDIGIGSCCRLHTIIRHICSMVLEVLLHFHLKHLSAGLVEGLPLESRLIDGFVVGLDEQHVLLEDADILETA